MLTAKFCQNKRAGTPPQSRSSFLAQQRSQSPAAKKNSHLLLVLRTFLVVTAYSHRVGHSKLVTPVLSSQLFATVQGLCRACSSSHNFVYRASLSSACSTTAAIFCCQLTQCTTSLYSAIQGCIFSSHILCCTSSASIAYGLSCLWSVWLSF